MSDYIPLSVREGWEPEKAGPFEGVPPWLRSSIVAWVRERLQTELEWSDRRVQRVERALRFDPPLAKKAVYMGNVLIANRRLHEGEDLIGRISDQRNEVLTLNVLDFLLKKSNSRERDELNLILREGGSVWSVGTIVSEEMGLVRRVEPSFQGAADQAMAGDAQHHRYLRRAWGAAYGRNPQPDTAYRDAVRAVEAAAIPVVRPSRSPLTLGLVIAEIRDHPKQFATRLNPSPPLEPIEAVRQMLSLLWKSQWDRHGVDDDVPLTVSQQEAEDALALAVTLVRWFDTGAVSRRD